MTLPPAYAPVATRAREILRSKLLAFRNDQDGRGPGRSPLPGRSPWPFLALLLALPCSCGGPRETGICASCSAADAGAPAGALPDGGGTPGDGGGPGGGISCSAPPPSPTLVAVTGFVNPGNLLAYEHVPAGKLSGALVVALHGCTQDAEDFTNSGWSRAADAYGLVVLYPEQQPGNNPDRCFNWFLAQDGDRDGEAASIANAIAQEVTAHGLDARRVYVSGFSAGGAMAAVLLADYPNAGSDAALFHGFAGGQIVAGLPFRAACTGTDASTCPSFGPGLSLLAMAGQVTHPPQWWGDCVRSESPQNTVWPRVTLWQGTDDAVVSPVNLAALIQQWTNVWGVGSTPAATETVDGHAVALYEDTGGRVVVESHALAGMGHGVPIDPSGQLPNGSGGCGVAGSWFLDAGSCSVFRALQFWGEVPAGAGLAVCSP